VTPSSSPFAEPAIEALPSPSRALTVALTVDGVGICPFDQLHLSPPESVDLCTLSVLHGLAFPPRDTPAISIDDLIARFAADSAIADASRSQIDHWLSTGVLIPPNQNPKVEPHPAGPDHAVSIDGATDADHEHVATLPGGLAVEIPMLFRVCEGGFETLDHVGRVRAVLTPLEMMVLGELRRPARRTELIQRARAVFGRAVVREVTIDRLLARLLDAGIVIHRAEVDPSATLSEFQTQLAFQLRAEAELRFAIDLNLAANRAIDDQKDHDIGHARTRVIPVAFNLQPPLSLGMMFTYAKAFEGGALNDSFVFHLDWLFDATRMEHLPEVAHIFFVSNYVWSHVRCIDVVRAVKAACPESIIVCGGPDTPKYEADVAAYLQEHPEIDVVVHGEGEDTAAHLLAALAPQSGSPTIDLAPLAQVDGLTVRLGPTLVRTGARDRIADLDTIPSPFLTGLFDAFAGRAVPSVTLETNRGCPYGCTFCDWGSATLSRMRKFSMDRVLAELDWCATNRVMSVGLADSNFGMFERDVEIAEHVAFLRTTTTYPKAFGVSFAKNTTKHLASIIRRMIDADIWSFGTLSLQTIDDDTLRTIKRSNIKVSRYDELAAEFREAELPLFVEMMLGLPGATFTSFLGDLQQCIDREVFLRMCVTEVLVNSPMNDPEYRNLHQIETDAPPGAGRNAFVMSTATFTREEREHMVHMRSFFVLCENFGALRPLARFVRQAVGVREIDFYEGVRRASIDARETWPEITRFAHGVTRVMAPPVSWQLLHDELHRYLVTELGVPDDSALRTALAVQHALWPSRERTFPTSVPLEHDFGGWYADLQAVKGAGHRTDWTEHVAPLGSHPPDRFEIDDPDGLITGTIGASLETHGFGGSWEFVSPVARPIFRPRNLAGETLLANS